MLSGDLFKSGGEIAELHAVGVLQPRAAGEELFEMKGFGGTGTLPCWGPEPGDALSAAGSLLALLVTLLRRQDRSSTW